MLIKYFKFGLCNCSENFIVMCRCLACASVNFIDFFLSILAGIS